MHPDGWQGKFDEAARERLARINDLRRRAAGPLLALEHACREAGSAREQALALAQLFEDLDLAERLAARADELEASAASRPRTSMPGSGTRRSPRLSSAPPSWATWS